MERVSGTDGYYNSKGQARNSSSKYSLSLFNIPSMNITGVFIGGVTPPTYIYSSILLQRPYSWNIPGRTHNFPITYVGALQLKWARDSRQPSSAYLTKTLASITRS